MSNPTASALAHATKFVVGSRVIAPLWGEPRPGEVVEVINFTDKGGVFRERRLVLLDDPVEGLDDSRRWNFAASELSAEEPCKE